MKPIARKTGRCLEYISVCVCVCVSVCVGVLVCVCVWVLVCYCAR